MLHDSHIDDYHKRIDILSCIVRGGAKNHITQPDLDWLADAGFSFIINLERNFK